MKNSNSKAGSGKNNRSANNSNKGKGKDVNAKRGRNTNSKSHYNGSKSFDNFIRKGKESEVNIPDSQLNKADLNVITKDNHANNDPSWYNKLGQIYQDATSIPFNVLSGLPFNPLNAGSNMIAHSNTFCAPGVMTVRVAPTIGVTRSINDPANIAAQNLYVEITKANNRDGQYDKTDVMLLIVAMDSAYMLYEFLNRVYRAFGNISAENRYYPLNLLHAMKVDTETLQKSLADFRSRINLMAYRLASINVPDVFSFISRHSWLFSHVYKDADTDKAQAYMYMPDGFYVWKEGQSETPNYLSYVTFEQLFGLGTAQEITLEAIDAAIDTVLTPLLGSSFVGLISSDIAKAYPENGMIKISEIDDGAKLEPQYDEAVLMQMQNCKVYSSIKNMDITQNISDLVSGPYLVHTPGASLKQSVNYAVSENKHYINVQGNSPSNDLIGEATRLICVAEPAKTEDPSEIQSLITCGTEIVTGLSVWYLGYSSMTAAPVLVEFPIAQSLFLNGASGDVSVTDIIKATVQNSLMSAFDWSPTVYQYVGTGDGTLFMGLIQDLDNYTFLSPDQIKGLNDAIVMSEFAVN